MSEDLAKLMPQMALDIKGKTVFVELICTDAYAARVLFDDLDSRLRRDGHFAIGLRVDPKSAVETDE